MALRVSDAIQTPMTWGAIRPVILLPAYVEDWPAEQRDVVIRHERAHIERRDWLWQAFAQVMTAIFWFHPLVWLAAAQMRQEAEHAADDATLAAGVQAPDYADRLMAVARQLSGHVAGCRCSDGPETRADRAHCSDSGYCPDANAAQALARESESCSQRSALLVPLSAFQNRKVYHAGEDGTSRSVRDLQGRTELHAGSEGSQDPGDGQA